LKLTDSTGQPIDLTGEKAIFLCRCGASVTKPFCDGTHTRIGFQAAEAAVRAEG
jgi:CDGSH-type Zn-finger protein